MAALTCQASEPLFGGRNYWSGNAKALNYLGLQVAPGKMAFAENVTLGPHRLPIPLFILHGRDIGPRLCLVAGAHGDEINGIEAVRQVVYRLDPANLHGTVIALPILNSYGYDNRLREMKSGDDMNRLFPGIESGPASQQLTWLLMEHVISHCDGIVDYHTGTRQRVFQPHIKANLYHEGSTLLAQLFEGLPIVHSEGPAGSLRRVAQWQSIPAVVMEIGGSGELDTEMIETGVRHTESLLFRLDMERERFRLPSRSGRYYVAQWMELRKGGFFLPEANLGDQVDRKTLIAQLVNPRDNKVVQLYAPTNGKILGIAASRHLRPGDPFLFLGREMSIDDIRTRPADEIEPLFEE